MAKWGKEPYAEAVVQAERAFKRALELNPDLPVAHNLYAQLELELGRAQDAMLRLLRQAGNGRSDPELFAGLCSAARYCGLLEASRAAHQRAKQLDPKIRTSIIHTYFQLGEYEQVLEGAAEDAPLVSVMSLLTLGRVRDARTIIDRITGTVAPRMRDFLVAVKFLVDERRAESVEALDRVFADFRDPEGRFYFARQYAYLRDVPKALGAFGSSVDQGFFCYPAFVRDPWLDPVRHEPEFQSILQRAEARHRAAVAGFEEADGHRVLGLPTTRPA
jgi:tetratricopeptide (TPR) repeat protein